MHDDWIQKFLAKLAERGWLVGGVPSDADALHPTDVPRYSSFMPAELFNMLARSDSLMRQDQGAWFWSPSDYLGRSNKAHLWTQVEVDCIEGARGDENWQAEIRNFWDEHFPIGLQVSPRCMFIAIRRDGVVVVGVEPEYEETTEVADSFRAFAEDVVADSTTDEVVEFIG